MRTQNRGPLTLALIVIAALALLLPNVVSAASSKKAAPAVLRLSQSQKHLLASALKHQFTTHSGLTAGAHSTHIKLGGIHLEAAPQAPASLVNSASSLASPCSDWPPHVTCAGSVVQDIATLDDKTDINTSPMAIYHTTSYVTSGIQGAYMQNGLLNITYNNKTSTFQASYLGSYYSTSSQAINMEADALSTIVNVFGESYDSCGGTCRYNAAVDTRNGTQVLKIYVTFVEGNALAEILLLPRGEDIFTNGEVDNDKLAVINASLNTMIDTVDNTLIRANSGSGSGATATPTPTRTPTSTGNNPPPPTNTPTPTPTATPTITTVTPPSVHVEGVELDHKVKKNVKTTKTLKTKEVGLFLIGVTFQNLGSNTPTASITFSTGGHEIATRDMTDEGTTSDGLRLFSYTASFKTKKDATWKATMVVHAGSAAGQGSLKFKVKAPPKK